MRNEKGITLIEIMVGTFLVGLVLLSIGSLVLLSVEKQAVSEQQSMFLRSSLELTDQLQSDFKRYPVMKVQTQAENTLLRYELINGEFITYENRGTGLVRVYEEATHPIGRYQIQEVVFEEASSVLQITFLVNEELIAIQIILKK